MDEIRITKLSKKYQITLPRNVRDFLEVGAHDEVVFYLENGEIKLTSRKNLNIDVKIKNVNKQIVIVEGEK